MDIRQNVRQLRRKSTDAERRLWSHLRNRRLNNWKFRRQISIDQYIVDFLCHELRLIIEVDGSQHAKHTPYELQRTSILLSKGYMVVRYWNNEVLNNTSGVLQALTLTLSQRERELNGTN